MHEIYLITNQINEKVYVGQTHRPLRVRFSDHKKDAKRGSDQYLHRSMRFYGHKYFTISRLSSGGQTQKEANAAEEYWVSFFRSNDSKIGYNQTSGGGQGRVLSEEARKKIGDACRKSSDPEQECVYCHKVKPLEEYHVNNAVSNGRMSRCKECCLDLAHKRYSEIEGPCRKKLRKERMETPTYVCDGCKTEKPLEEFHKSKNYPRGHSYLCKVCRSKLRKKSKMETDLGPDLGTEQTSGLSSAPPDAESSLLLQCTSS